MHSYDAGYGKFENKPSLFVRLVVTHPPRNIHLKLRSGVKIFRSDRPPGFAHYQVPIDFFKPTTRHWYGDVPARWSVYCAIFQGLFWKEKGCECVHIWHLILFQLLEGLHSSLNPFFFYNCILFHKVESIKFSQGENATHSPFRLLWPTRGKNFWDPLGGECMHLFLRVEGRSP